MCYIINVRMRNARKSDVSSSDMAASQQTRGVLTMAASAVVLDPVACGVTLPSRRPATTDDTRDTPAPRNNLNVQSKKTTLFFFVQLNIINIKFRLTHIALSRDMAVL